MLETTVIKLIDTSNSTNVNPGRRTGLLKYACFILRTLHHKGFALVRFTKGRRVQNVRRVVIDIHVPIQRSIGRIDPKLRIVKAYR